MGQWWSADHRTNLSTSHMNQTSKYSAKSSATHKGKEVSAEHRAVLSASHMNEDKWKSMLEELKQYIIAHGDCLLPHRYYHRNKTQLGHWVGTQRQLAKLSNEQKNLDCIGFEYFVYSILKKGVRTETKRDA